ncbi:MAG: DUF5706 domain-containing protein [Bacteroidales bacterium]|jgi:hypothetical protein|nr:DUF5706 domain-containing protein [Bacteroidales bacterium]
MESNSQRIAVLEGELSRLLGWINTAETKISLVLAISTAMLGALAVLSPVCSGWTVSTAILASFATLCLVLSIVFLAVSSFPRTDGPGGSLIYFGGISSLDLSAYITSMSNLTEDQYINDLICQCHRNAQIAERKFTWVKRAIVCLFLSSGPWALSLYLLYSAKA